MRWGSARPIAWVLALAVGIVVGVGGVIGLGGMTAAAQDQITVAVMPFEGSVSSQFAQMDVARQLTNLVIDQLVGAGDFVVIERDRIMQVLDEQDLGSAGRIDPSRAPEIGRLLGADVMVFGTVTKFEMTSGAGISLGGFSLSGTKGQASLTGRIVDATTGAILGSANGDGEATGTSFSINNLDGISLQASEFQNSALGRAVSQAIENFVSGMSKVITANKDRVFASQAAEQQRSQLRGVVVALIDGGLVVNIGQQHGIRKEQRLDVFRLMEIPGMAPVRIPVGVVRVISVDAGAAVAVFESMTMPAEVGDTVAPQ